MRIGANKSAKVPGGARVKQARASGKFAPEALRGSGTFRERITRAKASLPKGPQRKKLAKTARNFRKSVKK